jgi:DNA-binding CsgD family transcriptional regulator/pimeloyl-ACP methyl ester carboxylesterase
VNSPPPAQYVRTSDGYDIAYFVSGTGLTFIRPPTVLNHTSRMWTSEMLGPFFDPIAERFKVVLYDGRGQGLSTRPMSDSVSIDDFVLDLEAVVDRVGGDRIVLFGASFFAIAAIRFAVKYPQRVHALILWEYRDYQGHSDALMRLAIDDWPYFVETLARTGFGMFDSRVVGPVLLESMSQADYLRQAQALRAVAGKEIVREVKVPTLILANRRGNRAMANEEPAKAWAAIIPGSRLVLLDGGAGFGEVRDGVYDAVHAILDFLGEIPPPMDGASASAATASVLSTREIEVLRLLAAGRSNQQIAEALVISANTVRRHVSNIFDKTGAQNRTQASVYARDHGLA